MLFNFKWIITGKLSGSNLPGRISYFNAINITEMNKDLQELKNKNIDVIVSLIENMPKEYDDLYKSLGFEHISYPISDFGIPKNMDTYRTFINEIISLLNSGKNINIHCAFGKGRTGMVLACIIGVMNKLNGFKAIDYIRNIWKYYIETEEQEKYIVEFLKEFNRAE